jgi:hypothetical protein
VAAGLPMPENLLQSKRAGSKHWAFQPVRRPELPMVANEKWVRNEVGRFILAKLEEKQIAPSPEAPKRVLLRRLSLDLTGLPPTVEQMRAFLADTSGNAYDKQVQRLLASPHYGERWGRHWLDIARYADSDGYTIDAPRDIWMDRDWVIRAVNEDMPFDRFVIEQMAGDLLPEPTMEQLLATGFHRNTMSNFEGGIDFEQYQAEAVADRKLFNKPFLELGSEAEKAEFAAWQQKVIDAEARMRRRLELLTGDPKKDEEQQRVEKELSQLRETKPKLPRMMIMRDLPEPRPAYIHLGGDFTRKGAPVSPGRPSVLPPAKNRAGNRLALAEWLMQPDHPLTARVTVNRVWMKYFGRGIVDTESDFGTQADKPTHPELLDWLAVEFWERGWSLKELHRLIVKSAA